VDLHETHDLKLLKGITDYDQFRFLDLMVRNFFVCKPERKIRFLEDLESCRTKVATLNFKEGMALKYGANLPISELNLNREKWYKL